MNDDKTMIPSLPMNDVNTYLKTLMAASKFLDFLQQRTPIKSHHDTALPDQSTCNGFPDLNKENYLAVLTLENLGLNAPTQDQIDVLETLILLVGQSQSQRQENLQRTCCN